MNRRYIYIMYTFRYFYLIKIGISNKPKRRAEEISMSIGGHKVYILYARKLNFAYQIEQSMHGIFKIFNVVLNKRVSGRHEFFIILILPFALAILLFFDFLAMCLIMLGIYLFLN